MSKNTKKPNSKHTNEVAMTKTKNNEWKMSIFQPLKHKKSNKQYHKETEEKSYSLIEKSIPNRTKIKDAISPVRKIKVKMPKSQKSQKQQKLDILTKKYQNKYSKSRKKKRYHQLDDNDPYPPLENPFKIYRNNQKIESILALVNNHQNRKNYSSSNLRISRIQKSPGRKESSSIPNISRNVKSHPSKLSRRRRVSPTEEEQEEKFSNFTYKMHRERNNVKVDKLIKLLLMKEEKMKQKEERRGRSYDKVLNGTLQIRKKNKFGNSFNLVEMKRIAGKNGRVKLKPKQNELTKILDKIKKNKLKQLKARKFKKNAVLMYERNMNVEGYPIKKEKSKSLDFQKDKKQTVEKKKMETVKLSVVLSSASTVNMYPKPENSPLKNHFLRGYSDPKKPKKRIRRDEGERIRRDDERETTVLEITEKTVTLKIKKKFKNFGVEYSEKMRRMRNNIKRKPRGISNLKWTSKKRKRSNKKIGFSKEGYRSWKNLGQTVSSLEEKF